MLFRSVNRNGKNPRENRSIKMARRSLCWAGVNFGFGGSGGMGAGCKINVSCRCTHGTSLQLSWLHRLRRPFCKHYFWWNFRWTSEIYFEKDLFCSLPSEARSQKFSLVLVAQVVEVELLASAMPYRRAQYSPDNIPLKPWRRNCETNITWTTLSIIFYHSNLTSYKLT